MCDRDDHVHTLVFDLPDGSQALVSFLDDQAVLALREASWKSWGRPIRAVRVCDVEQ